MWSSPIVVTKPAGEPVELEDVKIFLRIDGNALDSQIAGFIRAARGQVEATTSTRLMTQTVKVAADSFADLELLPIGPVATVVSIKYLDQAGAEQTLDSVGYETFGAGLEVGIRPPLGGSWPVTRAAKAVVSVTATVGYGAAADVPDEILLAILQLVRGMVDDAPADIEDRLLNYRIWL